MKTVLLVLLVATELGAQPGSIAGTVVDQANSHPIGGVHLRLYAGVIPQSAKEAYGAITDAGGHFSLASIPPGTYTVDLQYAGYEAAQGAGFMRHAEIIVHPGEHVADRQLAMLPLILIAGRVVNQSGDPVPNTSVRASAGESTSGGYIGPFSQQSTDERGQFRLFVTPGKYDLAAGPLSSLAGPIGPAEIRTDGSSDLSYAATYYPSASDAASATPVEAREGGDVTGLEIRLHNSLARRNLTVSGTVTGMPAGADATVSYWWGESPGKREMGSGTKVSADGRFSIENLGAGYLQILAQAPAAGLMGEEVEVEVQPPGVSDLRLALAPGGVVTGTVSVVGGDPSAVMGKLRLELISAPGMSLGLLSASVDRAGSFRIAGVTPETFGVRVDGLPEDGYVKTILLDGVSNDGNLDFTKGAPESRLKITVGLDGAEISGELRGSDGGPLLSARSIVFVAAEAGKIGPTQMARVADGRYLVKGVPPGKYKVYAADIGQVTAENRPAFLEAAETVDVPEGANVIHDLRVQEAPNGTRKQ